MAGYLENPEKGPEMEEETEAGEGGAFFARGDHCCQVIVPAKGLAPAVAFVCCFMRGRAGLAPLKSKLFPYPTELGKAIVDLEAK